MLTKRKILLAILVILIGNLLAIYSIYKSKVYRQVDFNLEINPVVYQLIRINVNNSNTFQFQQNFSDQKLPLQTFPQLIFYENEDFINFVGFKLSDLIESEQISDLFLKKNIMYKKTILKSTVKNNIKNKMKYNLLFTFYFEDEFKDLYFVKNYEMLKNEDTYINEFKEYLNINKLFSNWILEFIKLNLVKENNFISLNDDKIDFSRLKANFIFREAPIAKVIIINNVLSIIIIILFNAIFSFYNKNRKKIFKILLK